MTTLAAGFGVAGKERCRESGAPDTELNASGKVRRIQKLKRQEDTGQALQAIAARNSFVVGFATGLPTAIP